LAFTDPSFVGRSPAATSLPRRAAARFAKRRRKCRSWPCPRPSVFSVLVVHEHHDIVLQLSGELDLDGCNAIRSCIAHSLADGPRRLVLELSSLEFADPTGAAAIAEARRAADAAGVELIVDSPTPFVRCVLDLCGALGDTRVR
jgi:anti-anti-sigma factor